METTTNNLNTFRILFIVKGILILLFSLFFVAYAMFGYFFDNIATEQPEDLPFRFGTIFLIIGSIGTIVSLIFGSITLIAAKYIKELRNYNFIIVAAILNCFTGVLGILLGVFTIIELNKAHVKALFDEGNQTLENH